MGAKSQSHINTVQLARILESQYSEYKIVRFASVNLHFFLKLEWIITNENMRELCEFAVNTRNKGVKPNMESTFKSFIIMCNKNCWQSLTVVISKKKTIVNSTTMIIYYYICKIFCRSYVVSFMHFPILLNFLVLCYFDKIKKIDMGNICYFGWY